MPGKHDWGQRNSLSEPDTLSPFYPLCGGKEKGLNMRVVLSSIGSGGGNYSPIV